MFCGEGNKNNKLNETLKFKKHRNAQTNINLFNGLFRRTTWVSWYRKGKPFRILMKQEMMGWQWHQLDHMQIICTSLQTDNHATQFLQTGCPSCHPTNSVKALKAQMNKQK